MKTLLIGLIVCSYFNVSIAIAKELKFSMLEGSEAQNIALCVVQEAYKSIGITTIFKKYPTSRSFMIANKGYSDGETSRIAAISKKYKNLIMIPIPTIYMKGMAYTKTIEDFTPNGFKSLSPYQVIINHGAQFAKIGVEGLPSVYKVNNYQSAFKMLDVGRGDFVVAPYSNGVGLLRQLNILHINPLNPPLIEIPMYHFLHKKNVSLVPSVQEALMKMEASGRIEKIYDGYLKNLKDKTNTFNFDNKHGAHVPCPK